MREILFRGKCKDMFGWLQGYYVQDEQGPSILYQHPADGSLARKQVLNETVGQYTGLKDKNGVKIFEGDILQVSDPDKHYKIQTVYFRDGMFCGFNSKKTCEYTSLDVLRRAHDLEVIGNIHENPELMEV